MLFTNLFNCLKGVITNTRYIHTLETHSRLGLEMVRIRNGIGCINYPFQKGGISLLKFVPGIQFECGVCSLVVDVNTNPGYLNVENMLPTPLVVEIRNSNSHKNRTGKCDW